MRSVPLSFFKIHRSPKKCPVGTRDVTAQKNQSKKKMAPPVVDTLRCAIRDWLIDRFPGHDVTDDIVDHFLSLLIDEAENFDE